MSVGWKKLISQTMAVATGANISDSSPTPSASDDSRFNVAAVMVIAEIGIHLFLNALLIVRLIILYTGFHVTDDGSIM